MKRYLKSVGAAVALACVASTAFAAPPVVPAQPVVVSSVAVASNGNDALYLAAWDTISGKSLVLDTGLKYSQIGAADMTANLNFGTVSQFTSTFGASTTVQYEVFSMAYNGAADATSIRTTGNAALAAANGAARADVIQAAGASINTWENNFAAANSCNKANPCIGADFNDTKSFANVNLYATNYGGNLNAFTGALSSASVGTALSFYSLDNTTNDAFSGDTTATTYSGTWLLTSAGALTYNVGSAPVPLPAAAWLLLSGIAGVGGFARRRRSAQAA